MSAWFSNFGILEIFFLTCAVIGGFFVFMKFIMQLIGADADIDVDVHADSDAGFQLLSLYGLSSFFMMFGLVGLALYKQSQLFSVIGAVAAGLISVWLIGKIFKAATRLQSSGTLQISDAIGCVGTVYLTIPEGGTGRVTVNIRNHLREFDAIGIHGRKIATGALIRVVEANGTTLLVEETTN
ncbi:MAG: NfeD family protein [Syntrophobacterales bacterium]|jgi:membrane-bound ClpP family serine protease|nr:NfeD family protein [Syntrophobacterales bacterium]